MFYDQTIVDIRNDVNHFKPEVSLDINEIFVAKIMEVLETDSRVLDIGTGNGFILQLIRDNSTCNLDLVGIDNSAKMVEEGKKVNGIEIVLADNYNIPFGDDTFDVVTAKNVTRFSASEVFRILKPGGKFIFREYGRYKGLVEISKLFETRLIRARDFSFYTHELSEAGFMSFQVNKYLITRKYPSVESVLKVVKSYPYIEEYSEEDERKIVEYLRKDVNNLTITSDPFILIGGKT